MTHALMNALDYSLLDIGIRDVVRLLREAGFDTTDSGDGVSKAPDERAFDIPHVVCALGGGDSVHFVSEANRALRVLGERWRVEASYCPNDKSAVLLAMKVEPHREAR